MQEKNRQNDINTFDDVIVALINKFLVYQCITSNHYKNVFIGENIIQIFRRHEGYEVDGSILECDYVRQTPPTLNFKSNQNQQNDIHIPREDSVISLKDSYLELDFNAKQSIIKDYANGTGLSLINLRPIASFREIKVTTIGGKYSKIIS